MTDSEFFLYTVYVVVFRGDPLDLQQYRHTALLFVPTRDGDEAVAETQIAEESCEADTYYCNAVGFQGEFEFQEDINRDPRPEENFIAQLRVGVTKRTISHYWLPSYMRSVPVLNDDYEFNSQSWVQMALERLATDDYLTRDEYDQGVNDMIAETMKAEDEAAPFSI